MSVLITEAACQFFVVDGQLTACAKPFRREPLQVIDTLAPQYAPSHASHVCHASGAAFARATAAWGI
jgi:hypothetical protein